MPIYEYICADCNRLFEELVPVSFAGEIACHACGSYKTNKQMSMFGFVSKSSNGLTTASSSSGCSDCNSGHCGSCSRGH